MKFDRWFLRSMSVAALALIAFMEPSAPAVDEEYEKLKAEGETQFSAGSYALAHDAYEKMKKLMLPAPEARWVDFRLADTLWRSQAATATADSTKLDQARQQLEALVRDIQRAEDRDRVWAEVHESLADFLWSRRGSSDWGQAWPHYQQALDWWAGAKDIEAARPRYLRMIWTMAKPAWAEPRSYSYGSYGNVVPIDILDNALRIARSDNDKSHAHYLIAMTLRYQGGDMRQRQRAAEEFEAAIEAGKSVEWYDDALYSYGEWMMNNGRAVPLERGQWRQEPDYVKALEIFRRLLKEFEKGETRYYEQAKSRADEITRTTVGVHVSNIFLPDSEIQLGMSWRNTKRVDFAIYRVDLTKNTHFAGKDQGVGNWLQQIDITGAEKVRAFSKDTTDKGDYKPGNDTVRLDGKLPVGAYVIEAQALDQKARDLILVTDASLVLKNSGKQVLAYVCNAMDGSPLAEARMLLWERFHDGSSWQWRESSKAADAQGIAVFDLTNRTYNSEIFASAAIGDRQAFSLGNAYRQHRDGESWRMYAFTDRPAYRPGDTPQWKVVARKYDGSVYSTPAEQAVEYEITDPRGTKVKAGTLKLNAFGSAWTNLELTAAMPLGEYRVTFWDSGRHQNIGNASLFRLEEYKLPEFKVTVQTPEENGRKKTFLPGEKVEVSIEADYYFGGPVANATAEVIVYQNPFSHWWHRPWEYPWYYEDMDRRPSRYGGGEGQIIKRETIKTDATGKAALTFDSPANAGQDFEYRVEARVTDASRREIVGNGSVRVTRQRYYVYPRAEHNLYRPQDKVTVNIRALDANDQPVVTEGVVKLTRDYWYEIWIRPDGKEVKGPELADLRRRGAFPPPPQRPDERPWQLKFQGYERDDILTRTVKTTAEGDAEFAFTPEREGYYRLAWTSEQKGGPAITAETTVWVATGATTELGYRHGGLEIIVDKDTFRVGQKAPVMLSVPTPDRYVLFCTEGDDLYGYRLVHVEGTVKLIELAIEEKHSPNIFLGGVMVSDSQIFMDAKQVVVPPVRNFINLSLIADREQYKPREEGTFTLKALDYEGKPVSAEVALGLADESVYYIQQDYAGDIRQFYFGQKRPQSIQTQSTFQHKSYAKLVPGPDKSVMDARALRERRDASARQTLSKSGAASYSMDGDESAIREEGHMGRIIDSVSEAGVPGGPVYAGKGFSHLSGKPMYDRKKDSYADAEPGAGEGGGAGGEPAVQVRNDFRATVLWQPDVLTDKDGQATVKVKFPDTLTSWRATARGASAGNQFGITNLTVRTKQPLIVRLQAPRFFVVGDTVTVSAVINNNTDKRVTVKPSIKAAGVVVTGIVKDGKPAKGEYGAIEVPANGEARADWILFVERAGEARLQVAATGREYADAMEKTYLVHEHGIEKFVAKSGKVRGKEATVKLVIPRERKPESTGLTVQVTPSMAVTMLDALPYLADYPYGCTEQTMSRFLPSAVVAKTLKDLGLKPEAVAGKLFGGIEPEHADQTHPKGKHDLGKLDDMTRAGLDRLYDFQHGDGGWGWWKQGDSDHFMTAYVVWGMVLARQAGVSVKDGVLERGVDFLDKNLVEEEENPDMQAWMLHALAAYHAAAKRSGAGKFQGKAFENLWGKRDQLNAYTRALLALSANSFGYADKARTLIDNLRNGVKLDKTPDVSIVDDSAAQGSPSAIGMGTAHWGEDGIYWRWSDGGVEATAFALRALLAIDPKNELVEPVVNWLIKNRRGAQWSNTRDTAIVVLTLSDYLRASGELTPAMEYEVLVNGRSIAQKKLTAEDALTAPSRFAVDRELIKDGTNEIRIVRKSGDSPIYIAAEAKFVSLEEPIPPAGNEIFVRRQYYKMVGRPTLLKGYVYDREPLNDGDTVVSGDRVETLLTIEGKNNYEYLVFEDLKPAGLEAVEIRSGESLYAKELKSGALDRKLGGKPKPLAAEAAKDAGDYTGRSRWVYQELRDRKVALFIDKLPEGIWELRYDMRAESPGTFHALPVLGHAMYAPEIRCNGAEIRFTVRDRKQGE